MAKAKRITDQQYRDELDRLQLLSKFPELPVNQQDMIRALRQITETDTAFLHDLVSFFVDEAGDCPKPRELSQRAAAMRAVKNKPLGNPACAACDGTGWIHGSRMVSVKGVEAYEAEFS